MKTPSLDNFQAELKQKLEFRIQIYQKQVKRITEEIHRWVIDDSVDDNFRNFMLHSMIAGRKKFEELLKETNQMYVELTRQSHEN